MRAAQLRAQAGDVTVKAQTVNACIESHTLCF